MECRKGNTVAAEDRGWGVGGGVINTTICLAHDQGLLRKVIECLQVSVVACRRSVSHRLIIWMLECQMAVLFRKVLEPLGRGTFARGSMSLGEGFEAYNLIWFLFCLCASCVHESVTGQFPVPATCFPWLLPCLPWHGRFYYSGTKSQNKPHLP